MFEVMLGTQCLDGAYGPGPQNLIGGTIEDAGFFGEVSVGCLINGNVLASAVGLSHGVAQNSNEPWLKFILTGKVLYVAKKPLRHSISGDHLISTNLLNGGKTVTIKNKVYKVRVLKGANANPAGALQNSYDPTVTHGSEWNRLMYHISGKPFSTAENTLASEGITEGDWAQYSELELGTTNASPNGNTCFCQENGSRTDIIIRRGGPGVARFNEVVKSYVSIYGGWRPVLELVS